MKHLIITLFLFLQFCQMFGQIPGWDWASTGNGTNQEKGNGICYDNKGNIYITGFYTSPSITFDTIVLINQGIQNTFIVKYDTSGSVVWAKTSSGLYSSGNKIASDQNGNVYITGFFSGDSLNFDSYTSHNFGAYDIFLLKIDENGNVNWFKTFGGKKVDEGIGLAVDSSGNSIITGFFISDTLFIDSTFVLHGTDTIGGDVYITKFDTNGNMLWINTFLGEGHDLGTAVAKDINENIYVTGNFNSKLIVGSDTLYNTYFHFDIFILKLDLHGNLIWAKSGGSPAKDESKSITADILGNVVITGYYYTPSITFDTITILNSGGHDMFLAKLDSAGNFLWIKSSNGGQQVEGNSVITDNFGNIYVTGFFAFSPVTFGTFTLIPKGNSDLFIVKYDINGNVLWALSEGGISYDSSIDICLDYNQNLYITGYFQSDTLILGTIMLNPIGLYDMYVAKLNYLSTTISYYDNFNYIHVYPNPSEGIMHFKLSDTYRNKYCEIQIFNLLGEKVYNDIFNTSTITHEIHLPTSIYFYRIYESNTVIGSGKIIIH